MLEKKKTLIGNGINKKREQIHMKHATDNGIKSGKQKLQKEVISCKQKPKQNQLNKTQQHSLNENDKKALRNNMIGRKNEKKKSNIAANH